MTAPAAAAMLPVRHSEQGKSLRWRCVAGLEWANEVMDAKAKSAAILADILVTQSEDFYANADRAFR